MMQLNPAATTRESWVIFLSGILDICAMILLGISGNFVLPIPGQYTCMLEVLQNFNWPVLGIFIVGGIVGLFNISKLMLSLLYKYANPTIVFFGWLHVGLFSKM